MLYFFIFIFSIVLSMTLIPLLMRFAGNYNLIDVPGDRKIHSTAIPRIGGIAIGIGFMVPLLLWIPFSQQVIGLFVGGLIIHLFGLWDDVINLNYKIKFLGQLLGIIFAILYGDIMIYYVPFSMDPIPGYIAFPLTIFILLGVTNAINLADGLDGLAGGITFLSFSALFLLAHESGDIVLTMLIVAMSGALLGFLRFNTYPARVFMGDNGSQLLGFMLAAFTIILCQESNRALSPVIGLLILGLPILDTLFVIVLRIIKGRSPFSSDENHIHHRFMRLGFDHYESVVTIYSMQALFVVSAILLRYQSDGLILSFYLMVCAIIFLLLRTGERAGWQIHRGHPVSGLTRFVVSVKQHRLFTYLPLAFITVAIPLYIVTGSFWVDSVPRDFAVISGVLFIILNLELIFGKNESSMIIRGIAYSASIFIVYLMTQDPLLDSNVNRTINIIYFSSLAVALAIVIRYESTTPFKTTTMDYLVIFVILVISIMPKAFLIEYNLTVLVIKSAILLYGYEVLISRNIVHLSVINISVALSLAVLSVRGLLL